MFTVEPDTEFPKFAISAEVWTDHMDENICETVNQLSLIGVKELFLVVGGDKVCQSRDIIFREPLESPWPTSPDDFSYHRREDFRQCLDSEVIWEMLEKEAMDLIRKWQKEAEEGRKKHFEGKIREPLYFSGVG